MKVSSRNRKLFNLAQLQDDRWVFRYGPTQFLFPGEWMYFHTRREAVRTAMKHGWIVEDNNRMRRVHPGGMS